MVPESVKKAWQGLPEKHKVAVCRAIAKKHPYIFNRWIEAAGVKNFRRESLVARKAGSGPGLDAGLYKGEGGQLAAEVLVAYFTELSSEVNDQYLQMLKEVGNEEPETSLKIHAQLQNQYRDWPFRQLYLATALWVEDEFSEADIETVEKMAAELA